MRTPPRYAIARLVDGSKQMMMFEKPSQDYEDALLAAKQVITDAKLPRIKVFLMEVGK